MEECLEIFRAVDNQTQVAINGLWSRIAVSEITLGGETFYSQSIKYIKNAKGKKDRMVMLPTRLLIR
jgi:hypothetical protein